MTDRRRRALRAATLVFLPVALLVGGGYLLVRALFPQFYADNSVYRITYTKPSGWREVPPGPFTLFVFKESAGRGTMRASINEVQSEMNPTPELDTAGIADRYVEVTAENMPDWKAERMDDIHTPTENFSLIKRTRFDRTVYTAFCAKGNTTVVVSLAGFGKQVATLDNLLPDFQKLVSSFRFTHKIVDLDD